MLSGPLNGQLIQFCSSDFYKHAFLLWPICIKLDGKTFTSEQPAFSCKDREHVSLCHGQQSFSPGDSVGCDCSGTVPDSPSQETRILLSGFSPCVAQIPGNSLTLPEIQHTPHNIARQISEISSQDQQTGGRLLKAGGKPCRWVRGLWLMCCFQNQDFFHKQILLLRKTKPCSDINPKFINSMSCGGRGLVSEMGRVLSP